MVGKRSAYLTVLKLIDLPKTTPISLSSGPLMVSGWCACHTSHLRRLRSRDLVTLQVPTQPLSQSSEYCWDNLLYLNVHLDDERDRVIERCGCFADRLVKTVCFQWVLVDPRTSQSNRLP